MVMLRSLLRASVTSLSLWAACPAGAAPSLNHDVTPETIASTICVSGYTAMVRPASVYTNGVKLKLLQASGQDPSTANAYELDHIVPLALGGHPRALDNLQLQPWPEARRKDRIEVKLQCLVCSGQVSLAEAQTAIATDWESAYHRYASVPCHRDRRPTVRTADHGTTAPRPHSTAGSWLARVRQWLPTLSWHGLVRGSV
jgi:hypothetical protein